MKVLKFGGTSVGTVESLRNVKAIVEAIQPPVAVIVSALGGMTDKLISTAKAAARGDETYREEMEAISSRHFNVVTGVVEQDKRPAVISDISRLLADLKRMYDGVFLIRNLSPRTLDVIVSFGERLSSVIVSAMISESSLCDSLSFIKTEKWFSKNIADQKLTERLIRENLSENTRRAVIPGFISTDRDSGEITNLGRGGSDFTAALVAAALDAESLEIWTDVDGFMTADPRIVGNASVVPRLTFIESMELCTHGAKVIYPPTIYPVFNKGIPIKILNTFNPQAPGTVISDRPQEGTNALKGISAMKDISLFSIRENVCPSSPDNVSRSLNALAKRGITVFLVNVTGKTDETCFAVAGQDAGDALATLREEFAPELASGILPGIDMAADMAMVAVVGENMLSMPRLAPRIRNSLLRDGINVEASSEGVSDTTLSFVIPSERINRAMELIHGLIF